jgi:hemerythrin-like metal-binding protein
MVVWKENYQTGIDIIDWQHKGLVDTMNDLYSALSMNNKESALKPAADKVIRYTQTHFATEIAMMRKAGYPHVNTHHAQHEQLIIDAGRSLHECLHEGGDPGDFVNFLKRWFVEHITREDKAYSEHLTEYFKKHPEELAACLAA